MKFPPIPIPRSIAQRLGAMKVCLRTCTLLVFLSLPAPALTGTTAHHALSVHVDPRTGTLEGKDRITGEAGGSFTLRAGLLLDRLAVGGKSVEVQPDAGRWQIPSSESGEIEVEYHGRVESTESTLALVADSGWYPSFGDVPITYELNVEVPAGFYAVSPGKIAAGEERTDTGYRARFRSDVPSEGVSLFVGPYEMKERKHGRLRLRTYLHPEVADLADLYLTKTADYIDLYEGKIGTYPYSAFHVVSAVEQVGLGFPGLTYIGTQVLRLPFIPDTSLGHEVLHNWWGNGVFIDVSQGNWAEGLTTFMADYAYAERKGAKEALEMRLRWLREYAALPPESERPLTSFRNRRHTVSQAVGYHKAAMVFFMLRKKLGEEVFDAGIRRFWEARRFQAATWSDLQSAFEAAADRQLDEFFSQWLERAGAPELAVESANRRKSNGSYEVVVDLAQKSPPYRLDVPIEIEADAGIVERTVRFDTAKRQFALPVGDEPLELRVDPDFEIFRRLDPREFPPILRNVAFAAQPTAVIAANDAEANDAARALATAFFERAPALVGSSERLPAEPILIVGTKKEVAALLERNDLPAAELPEEGSALVWAARRLDRIPYVVVVADDAAALRSIAGPLPHYGSQSYLVFRGRKAVERGVWPVEDGPLHVRLGDL